MISPRIIIASYLSVKKHAEENGEKLGPRSMLMFRKALASLVLFFFMTMDGGFSNHEIQQFQQHIKHVDGKVLSRFVHEHELGNIVISQDTAEQ